MRFRISMCAPPHAHKLNYKIGKLHARARSQLQNAIIVSPPLSLSPSLSVRPMFVCAKRSEYCCYRLCIAHSLICIIIYCLFEFASSSSSSSSCIRPFRSALHLILCTNINCNRIRSDSFERKRKHMCTRIAISARSLVMSVMIG